MPVLIPILLTAGILGWLVSTRRSGPGGIAQTGDEVEVSTKTIPEAALEVLDGQNSRTTIVRVEDDLGGGDLFGPIVAFLSEGQQHVVRPRTVPITALVKRKDILSVTRGGKVLA